MTVRLLVATRTDVGRVRPGNEDALLVADDVRLVAVADGMGGHQAGEVASDIAITALVEGLRRGETMDAAITGANDAVFAKAEGDPALRGMGTTITAGVVDGRTMTIGHVGDSRAYLLRDGGMRQLTTDHSVVAELIAAGELTEEQALVDPRRAMITRALGIDASVLVDVFTVDLADGDRLLLCSDGLTTMIRDDEIAQVLGGADELEDVVDALVGAANDAGGSDNITVVVVDVLIDAAAPAAGADEASEQPEVSAEAAAAGSFEDTDQVPAVTAEAAAAGSFGDTDQVPAVTDDAEPGSGDGDGDGDGDGADRDDDLEELRHAIEETVPRRRWWQRRDRT